MLEILKLIFGKITIWYYIKKMSMAKITSWGMHDLEPKFTLIKY